MCVTIRRVSFERSNLFQVGEETLLELNHLFSGSALEMAQSRWITKRESDTVSTEIIGSN